jgi:hypothetical protein
MENNIRMMYKAAGCVLQGLGKDVPPAKAIYNDLPVEKVMLQYTGL